MINKILRSAVFFAMFTVGQVEAVNSLTCMHQKDSTAKSSDVPRVRFGYFWTTEQQALSAPVLSFPFNLYDGVSWNLDDKQRSEGIHVDHNNFEQIVIEYPGIYQVVYTVTARLDDSETSDNIRFALLLNGFTVPGSIYGTEISSEGTEEIVGQVIVPITEKWSRLRLVNDSADNGDVVLESFGGIEDSLPSSTASIYIERIADLNKLDD